jgi:Cu-Zn family superoxide dismutase
MIIFSENSGRLNLVGELSGLAPGLHSLHIHEQGDCSAPNTSSSGGHFELDDYPHPSPESDLEVRHVGNLGNVAANVLGTAKIDSLDTEMNLDSGMTSIIGRTVIVRAESDDFSSQASGEFGKRVGCGDIVAFAAPSPPLL